MVEFADFIAPFDAQQFRAEYYGKRPLHIRREGRNEPAILNWKRFNEVLAIRPFWNEESLKLFYNSRQALRDNYCDTADLKPGALAPANPDKVNALMGLGASLVANQVQRVCPEVDAVAYMLGQELAARVGANVYCSFAGVQAFQTHYDLHDVFAWQAEGEKVWHIYEARADGPLTNLPAGPEWEKFLVDSRGPLLFEVNMKPGDVLYLPRGQYHDALTGDRPSLHVTFSVLPAMGLALFKILDLVLARESDFRAYLPDARNEAELRPWLAKLGARIEAVMTSPAFVLDVLHHQRGLPIPVVDYRLPGQERPSWYSTLKQAKVVRKDTDYVIASNRGDISVGATYPAVEWLLQQRHFSVEDALARYPGVDAREFEGVLKRLVAFGFIAPTDMQQPAPLRR